MLTFISILTTAATVALCVLAAVSTVALFAKGSIFAPLSETIKKCAKVMFAIIPLAIASYLILRFFVSKTAPAVVTGDRLCVFWVVLAEAEAAVLLYDKLAIRLRYGGSRFAKKTRNGYHAAFLDKGIYGKYLTSLLFERAYGDRARYIYDAMIPRPDNSYTKADMVVVSPDGIFVAETKSRGGYLSGNILEMEWVLDRESAQQRVKNPVRENEENVDALCYFLTQKTGWDGLLSGQNGVAKLLWNVVAMPEDTTFNVGGELPARAFLARRTGIERVVRALTRRNKKLLSSDEVQEYFELLDGFAGHSAEFRYRAQREKRRQPIRDARQMRYALAEAGGEMLLVRTDECYWEKFLAEGGPGYWCIAPEVETALLDARVEAVSYADAEWMVGEMKRGGGTLAEAAEGWRRNGMGGMDAGETKTPDALRRPLAQEGLFEAAAGGGGHLRDLLMAEDGDMRARTRLGQTYLHGWGVPADEARAAECFMIAAAQGEPDAMYYMGVMREHGAGGLARDEAAAADWYGKAARAGHAGAKQKVDMRADKQKAVAAEVPAKKSRARAKKENP